jgi:hypothetical protein
MSFAYSLLGASFSARELRLAPAGHGIAKPVHTFYGIENSQFFQKKAHR